MVKLLISNLCFKFNYPENELTPGIPNNCDWFDFQVTSYFILTEGALFVTSYK